MEETSCGCTNTPVNSYLLILVYSTNEFEHLITLQTTIKITTTTHVKVIIWFAWAVHLVHPSDAKR